MTETIIPVSYQRDRRDPGAYALPSTAHRVVDPVGACVNRRERLRATKLLH